ncbi:MAG: hypothetical protein EOM59_19050 [Clostridia bacterium]|nr:hypothetical protein [Clostridia bacterium]
MNNLLQRNTLLFAAFAVVLIATAALFNACSKQESTEQIIKSDEVQLSEADLKFQNELVSFRDKVNYTRENPDFKSGETLDADDAILQMESLFNATYGFPDEHYGKTQTDRETVLIDVNNNDEVLLDDVVEALDEIINTVTQFYYQCEFADKGFLLLDLRRGNITENQLEIGVRSVIGEKSTGWNPFGPDDYWWYGNLKGDCDWIIGYGETDAAEKIQYAINSSRFIVGPPPGYVYSYLGYEQIDVFGHEYVDDNGETLIFYIESPTGTFTHDEQCMEPDEMNFHYFGEKEVIYNRVPLEYNKPPNWTFMECNIVGKEEYSLSEPTLPCIHHQNHLTYAKQFLAAINIIGPPIEL